MDNQELEALFRDLESDRVERKASDSDRNKIRQAVCAFANDLPNHQKPGVIFVGVNDDGSCASLPMIGEPVVVIDSDPLDESSRIRLIHLCCLRIFNKPFAGNSYCGWRGRGE